MFYSWDLDSTCLHPLYMRRVGSWWAKQGTSGYRVASWCRWAIMAKVLIGIWKCKRAMKEQHVNKQYIIRSQHLTRHWLIPRFDPCLAVPLIVSTTLLLPKLLYAQCWSCISDACYWCSMPKRELSAKMLLHYYNEKVVKSKHTSSQPRERLITSQKALMSSREHMARFCLIVLR